MAGNYIKYKVMFEATLFLSVTQFSSVLLLQLQLCHKSWSGNYIKIN